MSRSRREFLARTSLGVLAAAVGCHKGAGKPGADTGSNASPAGELPPGAPSAFATSPAVGPEVSASTFAEAEKLVQVQYSQEQLAQAAETWRVAMAGLYERRTGPRKVALETTLAPATEWNPVLPGNDSGPTHDRFVRSPGEPGDGPLPSTDHEIAFAPVTSLSRWIERKQLTSMRLTSIYLERLERFNPELRCVITLTEDLAIKQAKVADQEIAAGRYRGPLHGIPWGAKDLLDTAGIYTTYGAEPFRDRIPFKDAVVVQRLHEAGAVLVAKLSLGALALNDVWLAGRR